MQGVGPLYVFEYCILAIDPCMWGLEKRIFEKKNHQWTLEENRNFLECLLFRSSCLIQLPLLIDKAHKTHGSIEFRKIVELYGFLLEF